MLWVDERYEKLKISENIIRVLLKYQQTGKDAKEAGGILIGRYLKHGNDVVIDYVTEPSIYDVRKRYFFHRSSKIHHEFAQNKWENSQGTENYLGEWHSHPEKNPKPSQYDLKSWKQHMKKLDKELKFTFFIIVGTKSIGVWKGELETCRLIELKIEK